MFPNKHKWGVNPAEGLRSGQLITNRESGKKVDLNPRPQILSGDQRRLTGTTGDHRDHRGLTTISHATPSIDTGIRIQPNEMNYLKIFHDGQLVI